jgi:hypothetical protein
MSPILESGWEVHHAALRPICSCDFSVLLDSSRAAFFEQQFELKQFLFQQRGQFP